MALFGLKGERKESDRVRERVSILLYGGLLGMVWIEVVGKL